MAYGKIVEKYAAPNREYGKKSFLPDLGIFFSEK